MNIHVFYDRLSVTAAEKAFRSFRFFADSLESQDVAAHAAAAELRLPDFDGPGTYEVEARTSVGRLDPAVRVSQWLGPRHPTLIYHHGNNERPFDFGLASKNTFKNILLSGRERFPANLIALRAPYHQDLRVYMQAVRRLDNFAALVGVSARLIEELSAALKHKYGMPVIAAGISLGGWAVNLHRALYGSADAYVPLLAGAALDQVFLTSEYRRLTSPLALAKPAAVSAALNFEAAYARADLGNVYPLLARHDQFITYERQAGAYRGRPVRVVERGHTTAALASGLMRAHLLEALAQVGGLEARAGLQPAG